MEPLLCPRAPTSMVQFTAVLVKPNMSYVLLRLVHCGFEGPDFGCMKLRHGYAYICNTF